MNNEQVAHLWANKSRSAAKGSSFYFDGDTIYSYGPHFPIARHYKGIVLYTSRTYSVTTAKHKGIVCSAMSHLPSFMVDDVTKDPSGADVKAYAERLKLQAMVLSRPRDPQFRIEHLQRITDEANKFCSTFGFKTRFQMPDEVTLEALREKSKQAQAKKAKQTAERNARIERENAEAITEWIAGRRAMLPYTVQTVYLRARHAACESINGNEPDGLIMETSRGARVPLADAQRAFRFVMLKREKGWRRNGETFPVGEFQLEAVNEQGVVAGCHRVAWAEIERFAKTQNWI